jgi:parallel beta-helix repeat protein
LSVNTGITVAGNAVNIVIATNDDAAVQAAIDAAEVAGGKVILSRKYGLLAGVTLERGWVSIEGFSGGGYYEDGMDASGFFCRGSATCAITVQSGYAGKTLRGNTFRDFSITGPENYLGGTTRGIWFKYRGAPYEIPGDCPLVDRVNLQFIKLGIWAETTDSLSVTNCRICNLGTGLWLKNAINTTVSNNIIWDNPDYGIYMQGSGYGALITGNAMGRSAYDIVCDEAQSCTITGNSFTNDDSTPGVPHNSAIKVIAGGGSSRMAITGNTFTGSNPAGSVMRWLNAVIELTLSDNISISGNQFHYLSSTQPAVKIDRCNSINVSANSFSIETLRPISLVGANSKIHLGDNQHNGIITIPTPSQLDPIRTDGLRIFADNAAAIAGGLPLGASYVTTSGTMAVCIEDAAAKAYSDAVAAAGATVTTAQRQLISQFVAGEKAASRWTTHKRLYMFGWASANANKIDMVTATALGTWTGVTHSAGFSQANGSTEYFSLNGAAGDFGLTNANCSISVVCYAGDTRNAYAAYMGQATSGNQAMTILEDESNNIEFYGFHGGSLDLAGPTGVILGTRNAFGNYQTYRRSASGLTTINYNANAGTATTATWEVWRRGADGLPSNAKIGGAGVHTGMDSTAATAYTAAMKTLWEGLYGLTLP